MGSKKGRGKKIVFPTSDPFKGEISRGIYPKIARFFVRGPTKGSREPTISLLKKI